MSPAWAGSACSTSRPPGAAPTGGCCAPTAPPSPLTTPTGAPARHGSERSASGGGEQLVPALQPGLAAELALGAAAPGGAELGAAARVGGERGERRGQRAGVLGGDDEAASLGLDQARRLAARCEHDR